jgi:adenine-specific DNA methylase
MIHLKHVEHREVSGYSSGHECYCRRPGSSGLRFFYRINKKLDLLTYPIYDFLTTTDSELYNEDANKIIDEYDDERTLIFLDPPYIASCNNFYSPEDWGNMNNIFWKKSGSRYK